MPGGVWSLTCPGCPAVFEITTGVGACHRCGESFRYKQMVCSACKRLQTIESGCEHGRTSERCSACNVSAMLQPWEGNVGFRESNDWMTGPEYVEGPCPLCGAALLAQEVGLW